MYCLTQDVGDYLCFLPASQDVHWQFSMYYLHIRATTRSMLLDHFHVSLLKGEPALACEVEINDTGSTINCLYQFRCKSRESFTDEIHDGRFERSLKLMYQPLITPIISDNVLAILSLCSTDLYKQIALLHCKLSFLIFFVDAVEILIR